MRDVATQRRRFLPSIIIAAGSFLLLGAAVLALNYQITWQMEQDALAINISGRQRMLSQRLTKALLEIQRAEKNGQSVAAYREELTLTFNLFDSTLSGFLSGGPVQTGSGTRVEFTPLNDPEARLIATRAATIWAPYRDRIERVIQPAGQTSGQAFDETVAYASRHNLELLNLMNLLTSRVEQLSIDRASRLRLLQTIAFVLALFNFALILRLFQRQIRMLSDTHDRISAVLDNIGASVLAVDRSGRVVMGNSTAEKLFGYGVGALKGLPMEDMVTATENGLTGWRRDGTRFIASCVHGEVVIGAERIQLISVFDVTQEKEAEDMLKQMAQHDTLTGLPNRRLLEDRMERAIANARRSNNRLAVIFLDLDKFKVINDTFGHRVGDSVLREAAARLQGCVRAVDTVARFGGDEFVVLVVDVSNPTECARVSESILAVLSAPILVEGHSIEIGTSLGISLFPTDSEDAETLLKMADDAMYGAKTKGGNRAEFSSASHMGGAAVRRIGRSP